jgi:hypothetical protein
VVTSTERPLTDEERRQLRARLENARAESGRALVKTGAASAAVCGVLAVLTLVASTAPRAVVVGFWTVLWLLFTLWIGLPWRRLMRGQIPMLESALRAGRARVIRIQSPRVVEFEEEEDEGACYAFEHDGSSSIFIVGQEFYEDEKFPNADFSIVELLAESGTPIDSLVVPHGRKLGPERIIPAALKHRLELPDHLAVVAAPLAATER